MKLEIHCHTSEHSPCSTVPARDLVHLVHDQGSDGVVLTDHGYQWSDNELAELRGQCDVPDGFLILSGQEVYTKDFGDVLVYGGSESVTDKITLAALRQRFPGAALVWAHPYRGNYRPSSIELFMAEFDAIEALNSRQYLNGNKAGQTDWENWGFIATSGSDIHHADHKDFRPTTFDIQIKDLADLVRGIKDGLCLPLSSECCCCFSD